MGRLPENKSVWGFLCTVKVHPGDCEWNSHHFKQAEELLNHLDYWLANQPQPTGGQKVKNC